MYKLKLRLKVLKQSLNLNLLTVFCIFKTKISIHILIIVLFRSSIKLQDSTCLNILCITLDYVSNFFHHKTTKIVLYNYLLV